MTLRQTLFGFHGRIGRSTFWLSALAVLLLDLAVASVVSDWIHTTYLDAGAPHRPGGALMGLGFGLIAVVGLTLWAGLALKVKRAHDLGRSGWWLAIGLIPIYGVIKLLIELGFLPSSAKGARFDKGGGVDDLEDAAPPAEAAAFIEIPHDPAPHDPTPPDLGAEPDLDHEAPSDVAAHAEPALLQPEVEHPPARPDEAAPLKALPEPEAAPVAAHVETPHVEAAPEGQPEVEAQNHEVEAHEVQDHDVPVHEVQDHGVAPEPALEPAHEDPAPAEPAAAHREASPEISEPAETPAAEPIHEDAAGHVGPVASAAEEAEAPAAMVWVPAPSPEGFSASKPAVNDLHADVY